MLPTFNSAVPLAGALRSLAAQDYPGAVELLIIDGGSGDRSRELGREAGAIVLDNPDRHEEAARVLGVEAATGELILLLDADNELPVTDWLSRLVAAVDVEGGVVSADCLHHQWRPEDPPVTRLCALIGGTDPLAIELGWADRWAWHLGRWTGMPIRSTATPAPGVTVVELDPDRPPPMGSNGYLVAREALLATGFRPDFVHSDVVGDLAQAGWRFARVDLGVVHHYAPTLRDYWRKAQRRAARTATGVPVQRRGYRPPAVRLIAQALWSGTLVGPAWLALRGYRAHPDRAWALYPLLSLLTVAAYARATLARRVRVSDTTA